MVQEEPLAIHIFIASHHVHKLRDDVNVKLASGNHLLTPFHDGRPRAFPGEERVHDHWHVHEGNEARPAFLS